MLRDKPGSTVWPILGILSISGALVALRMDLPSYFSAVGSKVEDEVRANVPMELEIERARGMIGNLIPDIQKNTYIIAEEEVEVEELRDEIGADKQRLAEQRAALLLLRARLDDVGQEPHSRELLVESEVRTELIQRFRNYQTAEATIAAKQQMLSARELSLAGARQIVNKMVGSKRELELQVENLEARLDMLQSRKVSQRIQLDDDKFQRCRRLINGLRKRLDLVERLLKHDRNRLPEIMLDSEDMFDLRDQIDAHLGTGQAKDG
ncbi:MAG: hypothetical protein WD847_20320 [Pirellulales bacterium]